MKILILDDSFEILRILEKTLSEKLFFDVVKFCNPKEALDYLAQEVVDLIITDYSMPIMNGDEFIKEVKQKIDTPIIGMSSLGQYQRYLEDAGAFTSVYKGSDFFQESVLEAINLIPQKTC